MTNIQKGFAVLAVLAVPFFVFATGRDHSDDDDYVPPPSDSCGQMFTYVKSSDFTDSRVKIDFLSGDLRVSVDPLGAYKLLEIAYDYTGSDANDATVSVVDGVSTIMVDAPGSNDIEHVTVKLKKSCPDLCPNIEGDQYTIPSGQEIVDGSCVDIVVVVPPTDVCPNIEGVQETVPSGQEIVDGLCVDIVVTPPTETPPVVVETPAASHQSGGGCSRGWVFNPYTVRCDWVGYGQIGSGASTCVPLLTKYLRHGAMNDPEQVIRLETFLNQNLGISMKVDGIFGVDTEAFVREFQQKYNVDVLIPWKLEQPTGIVYLTTRNKINRLYCATFNEPIPTLVPWEHGAELK
jgi:peptidoglycan hydrolase-like protein with peptidoglycan-binding domain